MFCPKQSDAVESSESATSGLNSPVNLAIFLAGILAPSQLQAIASWNKLVLLLMAPLLCVFVFSIAYDYARPCANGELWVWLIGMTSLTTLIICVRCIFLYIAASALTVLQDEEQDQTSTIADAVAGSRPLLGLRSLLSGRSRGFFRALHAHDKLCSGYTNRLLDMLTLLVFLWGGVGVWLSISNIDEDDRFCKATVVRTTSHLYALFYVLLFTINLLGLFLKAVTVLVAFDSVTLEALRSAKRFDDLYCPASLPVVSILVRALLLRDVEDTEAVELLALQRELKDLQTRQDRIAEEQTQVQKEIESSRNQAKILAQRRLSSAC
jgi:hypothetical protein